jgi:LPXTG-motif cell wall-anchored protein
MKRITSLLLAMLALTLVAVTAVQAQEQYPQGTTAQQPSGTVEQQPTTTADQSTVTPSSELPATASPMPLVALGGLAAMAAGATLSRLRRKA